MKVSPSYSVRAAPERLERPAEAVPIWQQDMTHADVALADGKDVAELRDSIILKLAETLDKLGRNTAPPTTAGDHPRPDADCSLCHATRVVCQP